MLEIALLAGNCRNSGHTVPLLAFLGGYLVKAIRGQNVRNNTLPLPWLKEQGIYVESAVVHARYRKDQEFAQHFFKIFHHWFT